jgi:hypothetical protein
MPLRPFVIGHSSFRVSCDLRHWALVTGASRELGPWNLVLPHEMRRRSSDVTIQRFTCRAAALCEGGMFQRAERRRSESRRRGVNGRSAESVRSSARKTHPR